MSAPKLCRECGTHHHRWQGHVFASNAVTASNRSASNNASNRGVEEDGGGILCVAGGQEEGGIQGVDVGGSGVKECGSKQRWSREKYNAYQRDYMRKRRMKLGD